MKQTTVLFCLLLTVASNMSVGSSESCYRRLANEVDEWFDRARVGLPTSRTVDGHEYKTIEGADAARAVLGGAGPNYNVLNNDYADNRALYELYHSLKRKK